ncbi:type II toxin-antitoxin system YoeB family toxin [Nostoc sp. NMS4]|uniref:type II toxin-antitoxin system RelE/ParE family toxin n=1 Tax=Nostoc sp. NMS4 TaxID=2815390 RepID=UPI0025D1CECD|nr:type II toxin-antitoxin system YoeB family toxin [Nostoc sp. NMS4]MBN3923758.1 type II toxin-antitoxin system YoeB family toxin [Nostoc sp. NMS4]
MKNLVWSPTFIRAFKRLVKKNPELRSQIQQVLQKIAEDPFQVSLRSHKLKSNSSGKYSSSIDYQNRILFKFVTNPDSGEEEILLLTLGSHDDVY